MARYEPTRRRQAPFIPRKGRMSNPVRGLGSRASSSRAFANRPWMSRGRRASSRSADRLIRMRTRTSQPQPLPHVLPVLEWLLFEPPEMLLDEAHRRAFVHQVIQDVVVGRAPTLYARSRARVSGFTGTVVVVMT